MRTLMICAAILFCVEAHAADCKNGNCGVNAVRKVTNGTVSTVRSVTRGTVRVITPPYCPNGKCKVGR
jgi:hypothetical protein